VCACSVLFSSASALFPNRDCHAGPDTNVSIPTTVVSRRPGLSRKDANSRKREPTPAPAASKRVSKSDMLVTRPWK
jgi:hypothetical protein